MASLGTLELGTYSNVSSTAIQGSDPVLESIAGTNDADYVYDATNSTHTGTAQFTLANVPADLGNVDTLSINLRYRAASALTNTWDSLQARVFKSDGTTALTNVLTVASSITTTTITNSGATAFTGVDTAATKADWDGAVVRLIWNITKIKGGDTVHKAVYAAEITGTYTADTGDDLLADDIVSGTPTLTSATIGQIHVLNANDVTTGTPTLTSAAVGQKHVLTADDAVSGTPTLTSPSLGISHILLANDISAGTPTLTSPSIGQVHIITADDVATGVSTLTSAAIGQAHVLLANDVSAGTSTLESPFLTEIASGGVVVATVQGGGGGRRRGRKLPEYYSRRGVKGFEKVALPQEEEANEVALQVVSELANLNERIDESEINFASMLAQAQRLERLVATYIESAQIYALMAETKRRLEAARDAEIKEHFERMELEELMSIL